MLASGFINVLLVIFVKTGLHGDALILGWLTTGQGSGGLLGALLIGQVSNVLRPVHLFTLAFVTAGAFLLLMVNIPLFALNMALIILIGLTVVGFFVTSQTLLQGNVADEYRGRVFGALNTTNGVLMLVGMGIASSLGDSVGAVLLLDVAGILFLLAAVLSIVMLQGASIPRASAASSEGELPANAGEIQVE